MTDWQYHEIGGLTWSLDGHILKDSIHGFSHSCTETTTEQNPNGLGEHITHTQTKARTCGFTYLLTGTDRDDLMAHRQLMQRIFSHPGNLIITQNSTQYRLKNVRQSRGYPLIRGGTPTSRYAKYMEMEVEFLAPDPYFYGPQTTITSTDSGATLTIPASQNPGTVKTPLTLTVAQNPLHTTLNYKITNTTTNETITGRNASLAGQTITITDTGVTISGNNLKHTTPDTTFWMLTPGANTITGATSITFSPRWDGI